MSQIKVKKSELVFSLAVFLMLGVLIGMQVTPRFSEQRPVPDIGEVVITMPLPAVDSEGNGVVGTLFTTVKPGSGRILVDTSKVLNYLDTQLSARIAATAASNYARVSLNTVDITYAIKVNASIIEGPSAGASMAVSVLLALENRTSDGIAMTGTINPDGTIGRVGAIVEKGLVAKENGARIYLVPEGQAKAERTTRNTTCSKFGAMDVCRVRYETETIDLSSFLGIEVHEVKDIGEALAFFPQGSPSPGQSSVINESGE